MPQISSRIIFDASSAYKILFWLLSKKVFITDPSFLQKSQMDKKGATLWYRAHAVPAYGCSLPEIPKSGMMILLIKPKTQI